MIKSVPLAFSTIFRRNIMLRYPCHYNEDHSYSDNYYKKIANRQMEKDLCSIRSILFKLSKNIEFTEHDKEVLSKLSPNNEDFETEMEYLNSLNELNIIWKEYREKLEKEKIFKEQEIQILQSEIERLKDSMNSDKFMDRMNDVKNGGDCLLAALSKLKQK